MSMNRRPCTSCQNENGEFIGLQLQGDISKPHEALKIIAALSLTIIILITLTLLFIIVNIFFFLTLLHKLKNADCVFLMCSRPYIKNIYIKATLTQWTNSKEYKTFSII